MWPRFVGMGASERWTDKGAGNIPRLLPGRSLVLPRHRPGHPDRCVLNGGCKPVRYTNGSVYGEAKYIDCMWDGLGLPVLERCIPRLLADRRMQPWPW